MTNSKAYEHFQNKEFSTACNLWRESLTGNALQWPLQDELAIARKEIMQMTIPAAVRTDFIHQWEEIDVLFGLEKDEDILISELTDYAAIPFSAFIYDDFIFLSDERNHRLLKISLQSRVALEIGTKGQKPGTFWYPAGLEIIPSAISRTNDMLVCCDCWNHRLQFFSLNGDFIREIGHFGEESHQFKGPYDLAVTDDGHLWVSDRSNHRIKKLNLAGETIEIHGKQWDQEDIFGTTIEKIKHDILLEPIPIKLEYPGGIWMKGGNQVIISDRQYTHIALENGNMYSTYGNTGPIMPRNLTGDDHRLLVKDEVTNDLYCMASTGLPICRMSSDNLMLPLRNTCRVLTLDIDGRIRFYRFKSPEANKISSFLMTGCDDDVKKVELTIKACNESNVIPDNDILKILDELHDRRIYETLIVPLTDLWKRCGSTGTSCSDYIAEYVDITGGEFSTLSDKVFEQFKRYKGIQFNLSKSDHEKKAEADPIPNDLDWEFRQSGVQLDKNIFALILMVLRTSALFNRIYLELFDLVERAVLEKYAYFMLRLIHNAEIIQLSMDEVIITKMNISNIIAEIKETYLKLADMLWEREDYDSAFSAWEELLSIDPANKAVHERLEAVIKSENIS